MLGISNFKRIIEHANEQEFHQASISNDQDTIINLSVSLTCNIEDLLPEEETIGTPSDDSISSSHHAFTALKNMRLHQLDLKPFDGDHSQSVTFINLFDSTVHHNYALSSVNKMHYISFHFYLRWFSKEPLNIIKTLNISTPNYISPIISWMSDITIIVGFKHCTWTHSYMFLLYHLFTSQIDKNSKTLSTNTQNHYGL